mmetsp:Transcript_40754/g.113174  ORF Transcript_40754/g.113174 Transcript_40754/m.113174 type:complete len:280 (-) Transcript_40754:133-972(-)
MALIARGDGEGRDPQLLRQIEEFGRQREGCQRAGNRQGEAAALLNIASTRLLLADLKDALDAATAARELSAKAKDTESELRELLLAGHVQLALGQVDKADALVRDGLALCRRSREARFADAAKSAVEGLAAAASAMAGASVAEGEGAVAGGLCALAHTQLAYGNFQVGLPAAKQALDHFEASNNRHGAAVAALALAQAHVLAGVAEDRGRQKMFLPPATRHAAAAAHAADRAKELCDAMGAQAGAAAAQAILDMERVRACFHLRKLQRFSYDSWLAVNS